MSSTLSESPQVLVIDDMRTLNFPAVHVRTLHEAKELLFSQPWREVWFDHDLGYDPVDGFADVMPLVNELERLAHAGTPHPINKIVIHTANPVGSSAIVSALRGWYEVRVVDANDYLAGFVWD